MTDITREAVEREAQALLKLCGENSSTAMLLALRTALDEAQRQRDTQRTDAYDARQDDLRELAEWRAMFARLAAQGLRGATPLMPNNWSQDVAFVAFALHGRRDRVAELEAAVRALEGATAPLKAERDAAIARAEAAEHDRERLEWMLVNGSGYPFRLQGVDSSWSVCDLRNGLTFVARNSATPREAIDQARAVLAKEGGDGAAGMARRVDLTMQLRRMVREHGSQQALARHLGISPQYLNDVLHGNRVVSDAVADLLGYKRIIIFVEKE